MGKFQIYQDGRAAGANPISGSDFVTKDYLTGSLPEKIWIRGTGSGSAVLSGSEGTAAGQFAVAEGLWTTASGEYSHAEGAYSAASGSNSHAEGSNAKARGPYSHAEGNTTNASGYYSHAEGQFAVASGGGSHAEGSNTNASGAYSHAEGNFTKTSNHYEHAQGQYNATRSAQIFSVGVGDANSRRKNAISIITGSGTVSSASIYIYGIGGYDGTNPTAGTNDVVTIINSLTGSVASASYSSDDKKIYFYDNNGTASGEVDATDFIKDGMIDTVTVNTGSGQMIITFNTDAGKEDINLNLTDIFNPNNYYTKTDVNTLLTTMSVGDVNVIEAIEFNGTASSISGKTASINVELPAAPNQDAENWVTENSASLVTESIWIKGIGVNSAILSGSYQGVASNENAIAHGSVVTASGQYSHAEGEGTEATERDAHAEGYTTHATGQYSHAEGGHVSASGYYSHAEGYLTVATGEKSHAEGSASFTDGYASHAEGYKTTASVKYSHAEGDRTIAINTGSHAEGSQTYANGKYSHAEGRYTTASGDYSHAEGSASLTSGNASHAEGWKTTASGEFSHAEGDSTRASGLHSHAEGHNTAATIEGAHAEGSTTVAGGYWAHAEGTRTRALGDYSHAEGNRATASANYSHAEGYRTVTSNWYEHAQGQYNATASGQIFSVGVGDYDTSRKNAVSIITGSGTTRSASVYIYGVGTYKGNNPEPGVNDIATVISNISASSGGGGITAETDPIYVADSASLKDAASWVGSNSSSVLTSETDPIYLADSASLKASASLASSSNYRITHAAALVINKGAVTTLVTQRYGPTGSVVTIQIPTTASHLGAANATHSHAIADVTGLDAFTASLESVVAKTASWEVGPTAETDPIYLADSASLKASASLAHSHSNAALLNSLTNTKTGSWDAKESTDNKVTAISSTSTNTEYPSAKAVQDRITGLSGSATIASSTDGVVVIKRGILQTAGVVGNNTDADITLHKIATSGNPSDIVVIYDGTTTNLQAVLNQIKSDIDSAAASGTEYIVCDNVASEIPAGFQYYNGVTGTLAASAQTAGKIYLVKNGTASYNQVTTTLKDGVYSWTNLGSTVVDLSGVIKTITVNGKAYGASGGSMIDIGDVITSVTAQTEINNSNKALVHVVATTGEADSTTGTKAVALEAQAKTATVASGETGLAIASDVKDYVDNRVVFRTWTAS